jgi:hypothetical protein
LAKVRSRPPGGRSPAKLSDVQGGAECQAGARKLRSGSETESERDAEAMLSYVNIFSKDIVKLSGFYRDLFGFEEIAEIRSPIFVGLCAGPCCLGFNAQDAYDLLKLSDYANHWRKIPA